MSTALTIEHTLVRLLTEAIGQLGLDPSGAVPRPLGGTMPEVYFDIPKERHQGDLATPVALRLARELKQPPLVIARTLVEELQRRLDDAGIGGEVERMDAAPPGFVNIFLSSSTLHSLIPHIRRMKARYGTCALGGGRRVCLEFASANPTGPLSIAHGRQAAVGDSLARILTAAGYEVCREYYLNDKGRQIALLGRSVWARYHELLGLQAPFPEEGYRGAYIYDIAQAIQVRAKGRYRQRENAKTLAYFSRFAMRWMLRMIRQTLQAFRVVFDQWSSQAAIEDSGQVEATLRLLRRRGCLYEQDGALWFASTRFGDDKDRVLRKQDGDLTYLAPDIAYHRDKYRRRFDRLINLWGPDHHGYIPRLKGAMAALGLDAGKLDVLIVQLTTLYRGGQPVRMSTRAGEFISLRELMEEVGCDAARFFFLMRRRDSHLDFDLELAKQQSPDNPVYYVQYAHARICSIAAFRNTKAKQLTFRGTVRWERLAAPDELEVLRRLREFPLVVESCARQLEPHGLTIYLRGLAMGFHSFYAKHRVISDDAELSQARLALVESVGQVLRNGLGLLGIEAPRQMARAMGEQKV